MFVQIQFWKSGGTKLLHSETKGAKFCKEIENHYKAIKKCLSSPTPILKKTINAIESKVFNILA